MTASARAIAPPHQAHRPSRHLSWAIPMAPAIVLLAAFVVVPVGFALYISFTNTRLTGREAVDPQWIGLDNFRRLIDSGDLANSAKLTVIFVIGSALIGQNLLGLALALLMARRRWPVRIAVSGIVLAAYVFPEIVPGFMWSSFLSEDGALNALLRLLGLPTTQILVDQPMIGVIAADIWRATAFSMLVYTAALANIDNELLEAASVDGASYGRTLWHIQLPLLRRTAFTNLMVITLPTLSVFTMIFALTGGGPGNRSETLPILMYNQAFRLQELAYGTSISLVILGIGGLLSVAYVILLRPGRR
jgi:multiple sugar transport system permease protein